MANIIKIKRSNVSGVIPTSLEDGELAINQADKVLFYKDNIGIIRSFNLALPPGSVSFTEVIADFGSVINAKNNIRFTVPDASVLEGSNILCSVSGSATADHSTDEIMLLQLTAYAANIVEGVGFDIQLFSPHEVHGQIKINYLITN